MHFAFLILSISLCILGGGINQGGNKLAAQLTFMGFGLIAALVGLGDQICAELRKRDAPKITADELPVDGG